MWQFITNIFSESIQSVGVVLMGGEDLHRIRLKSMNSAERFIAWGKESNRTLEYEEALTLLDKLPKYMGNFNDELRFKKLYALSYSGMINCKLNELKKFNTKISKKYDTDEFMDNAIFRISNRMKELQAIIAAAESSDTEQLKLLLGDQKVQQTRVEELALDARKEYEIVEDDFIMKSSVKENKTTEIKNFKTVIITEVDELQDKISDFSQSLNSSDDHYNEMEKEAIDNFKADINKELNTSIDKLNKAGIAVKKN
ncbi:MAG: hypothetical protein COA79_20570 [Planctomycetota bacterium]|nr:MAG: hypothetical protein COA79_20570 [Planctomycetota bacterium]